MSVAFKPGRRQFKQVVNAFTAGVISERGRARRDIRQYYSGGKTMNNVLIHPQGGFYRRPPLKYDADLGSEAVIIPFDFSTTQDYIIALTENQIEIFKDGVSQTTIVTTITLAQAKELNYTQSADTLILVHEDHYPKELIRNTDVSWTYQNVTFDYIPKYPFTPSTETPTGTLTPSAKSGTITLASSTSQFLATDVGGFITGNGGEARITKFNSTAEVEAIVTLEFIDTSAIASGDWEIERGYENAWSATRGYPKSATFHQGRLWFGGSKQRPQTLWGSRVGRFFDFDLNIGNDNDALDFDIEDDQVNAIQQLMSGESLEVLTSGAEFEVTGRPITPADSLLERQDTKGCRNVKPVFVEGATIFAQNLADNIYEFLFDDMNQKFQSINISLTAHTLIKNVVQMAYERPLDDRDANLVYVVNTDGTWAVLNTIRKQDITAWVSGDTRPATDKVLSIASINGVTYAVVQRTINSVTKYYLEQFQYYPDSIAENGGDDCWINITNSPASSAVSGLTHLAGEEVRVIGDGFDLGTHTVDSSGEIADISRDSTEVYVALAMEPEVETHPVEKELRDGTILGDRRRIVRANLILNNSFALKVNDIAVRFLRLGQIQFNTKPSLFTGTKRVTFRGYSDSPTVKVTQSGPFSMEVAAVVMEVKV